MEDGMLQHRRGSQLVLKTIQKAIRFTNLVSRLRSQASNTRDRTGVRHHCSWGPSFRLQMATGGAERVQRMHQDCGCRSWSSKRVWVKDCPRQCPCRLSLHILCPGILDRHEMESGCTVSEPGRRRLKHLPNLMGYWVLVCLSRETEE